MSTFMQRPPGSSAAEPCKQAQSPARAASLADARTPSAAPRAAGPQSARAAVLRPINLERRARFARMEADASRGA